MSSNSLPLREVMKQYGRHDREDPAGESRRRAAILNDAFSKLHLYWAFRAYGTCRADRAVIQFRACGEDHMVEVDAARFLTFLRCNSTHGKIREALAKKLESTRTSSDNP